MRKSDSVSKDWAEAHVFDTLNLISSIAAEVSVTESDRTSAPSTVKDSSPPSVERAIEELSRKSFDAAGGTDSGIVYSISPQQLLSIENFDVKLTKLSSIEAIGLILQIAAKPTLLESLILERIGEKARRHQYEGRWMDVHHLLKVPLAPCFLLETLIERGYSLRDVFGNILKMVPSVLRRISLVSLTQRSTINRPQRKRGYSDHGSMKPAHRWLPDKVHLGPNSPRLDLSGLYKKKYRVLNFLYQ